MDCSRTNFDSEFIKRKNVNNKWNILVYVRDKVFCCFRHHLFHFILSLSLVVGSIYVFTYFYLENNDPTKVECFRKFSALNCCEMLCLIFAAHTQNMILFGVLTIVAISGIVVLIFIMPSDKIVSVFFN